MHKICFVWNKAQNIWEEKQNLLLCFLLFYVEPIKVSVTSKCGSLICELQNYARKQKNNFPHVDKWKNTL